MFSHFYGQTSAPPPCKPTVNKCNSPPILTGAFAPSQCSPNSSQFKCLTSEQCYNASLFHGVTGCDIILSPYHFYFSGMKLRTPLLSNFLYFYLSLYVATLFGIFSILLFPFYLANMFRCDFVYFFLCFCCLTSTQFEIPMHTFT